MRTCRNKGFTLVEVMCALMVATVGLMTLFGFMAVVRDKAVWTICNDAGVAAAVEDVNVALATPYNLLEPATNSVTLYFTTDLRRTNEHLMGVLRRYVAFPEGSNCYASVRSEVVWPFLPYKRTYTNWIVTYVFP